MTTRQHLLNLLGSVAAFTATTGFMRVAADHIDSAHSTGWIDAGAVAITLWAFAAIWFVIALPQASYAVFRDAIGRDRPALPRQPRNIGDQVEAALRDRTWSLAQTRGDEA